MGERVQQLVDLSLKRPVIRLNGEKFKSYIGTKSLPRNYSFVVMMTALSPQRQCQICRQASDEFNIVANSWRYSPLFSSKLFFGVIDYDEGKDNNIKNQSTFKQPILWVQLLQCNSVALQDFV